MKAANAAIRKHKTPQARVAALIELGFTEKQAKTQIEPDFCGRVGFPAYALQNNNANARRIEARIKELEAIRARVPVVTEEAGYTYKEDPEENRVMFCFPEKPSEEVRKILRDNNFNFSPSRSGAWVRKLTAAGLFAARSVRAELAKIGQQ